MEQRLNVQTSNPVLVSTTLNVGKVQVRESLAANAGRDLGLEQLDEPLRTRERPGCLGVQ